MPYLSLYIRRDMLDGYTSSKHVRDFSIEESDKAQMMYETLVAGGLDVTLDYRNNDMLDRDEKFIWEASTRYNPITEEIYGVYVNYESVDSAWRKTLVPLTGEKGYIWADLENAAPGVVRVYCFSNAPDEAYSCLHNYVNGPTFKEKITPLLPEVVFKTPKPGKPEFFVI